MKFLKLAKNTSKINLKKEGSKDMFRNKVTKTKIIK